MTDRIDHAQAAELYGSFSQPESAIIAAFERATVPLWEALEGADTIQAYEVMSQTYGIVQTLDACRRNRFFLAKVGACVDALGEQLREANPELSIAAAMFLDAQTGHYQAQRAAIERCLLDTLLGRPTS